jgi:hypothetical protein
MSSHRFGFIVPLLLTASVLAGCGKNSPTTTNNVSQQDADDAAQQVGLMMAQGNGGSPTATSAAPDLKSAGAEAVASDTTFVVGHVTWTLTRAWFDAGGVEQLSYDPLTTVRVAVTSRGVGSIETVTDTASFGGAASIDIHGISILEDTLTTNVARHDTLACSFTPRFRTGRVHTYAVSTGAWNDVVQLKPVNLHPWPISGTAAWTLVIDRLATGDRGTVTKHFEVSVVVTFNGTQSATVTATGGYRYHLNLTTGAVTRV